MLRLSWFILCKLVVHPLLCWAMLAALGVSGLWLVISVIISATASQRRDGRWVGSYISQNQARGAYADTCDYEDCSNEKEAQQLALSVGWRLADDIPVR